MAFDNDNICRTCLNRDSKYFQIYDYADENKAIWEMLDGIVPQIRIKDDNIEFSSLICETCVDKLLSSYKFQQLCIDADNQFRQQILFTCEVELKEVTVKPDEDYEPSLEDESGEMKIEIYDFDGKQENESNDNDADTSNHKKIDEVAKGKQEKPLAEPFKIVEPENNDDTEINKPLQKLAVPFRIVKLNSRKKFCCTDCGKLYDRTSRIEQHLHSKHKYTHEDIKIFFKCFDYNENLIEEYHQEDSEVNNTSTELAHSNEDFDDNQEWLNLLDYVEDSGNISSSHEAEDDKHIDFVENTWRKTNRHGQKTLNTDKAIKKKYYCTVCGRKFVRMSRLITHRCLHAKRRTFVCNICNCSFANEQIYFSHRKRHKVDELYLDCPESETTLIEENHKEIRARSLENGENNKDYNESKEWLQSDQQFSDSKNADAGNRTDSKNTVTHEIERTKNRGNGNFPCEVCGKIFNCLSRLKRHSPVHSLDKPYDCEICKRRFSTFHYLKIHKLLHEKNEQEGLSTQNRIGVFTCPDCPKRFGKQAALASHRQVHTRNTANYSCLHCQRNFMSTKTLTDHIKNKHPEEKYGCEQCDKTFVLQEQLQRHLRAHKDLGCTICGKEFTSEPTLKEHMNIHSGQNPYLCPECGKNFKYASSLRRHIERHSEIEKYLCPECPKGFKCRSDLNRHIKNHRIKKAQVSHTMEQPKILNFEASSFKCHKCKIRFASASYLRLHMRTHNKAKATVEFCTGK